MGLPVFGNRYLEDPTVKDVKTAAMRSGQFLFLFQILVHLTRAVSLLVSASILRMQLHVKTYITRSSDSGACAGIGIGTGTDHRKQNAA
jgi:hypothetical protein